MSYYYSNQPQSAPTVNTPSSPSPSNLDISCIIDPVSGKGGLYVGNITAATNNELLTGIFLCELVNGIKAMLTSAIEANFTPDNSVTPSYLKLPALDYPSFSLEPYLEQAADFIHQNMSITNVLVHCMAGVSRSVSFVIAYLMKYRNMSFEDALNLMRARRSISNPNEGFVDQLKKYEQYLKRQSKAEQKKRKKMEKMLRNHHPALNQIYQAQNEQNKQLSSQKSLQKSIVGSKQQQTRLDKSRAQQPSILRSSQTFNNDALKSSNSLGKVSSQLDLYKSQATKPQQAIPNSPQQPSRQPNPTQQTPSQNQAPQTNSFLTQVQSQNQIPSTQQYRPQSSTPSQLQQNQYGMYPQTSPYNVYNPYNMYNQMNMYGSQNPMAMQNPAVMGQTYPYTNQIPFQQGQYNAQQLQYNQMIAQQQQQLSTSFGGMVDSRTADPIQKLKSMQDLQNGRRNNVQPQNAMSYGQNMANYSNFRNYGFY